MIFQSIGAINCIIRRPTDGKLYGLNTDYVGAISAIEDGLRGLNRVVLANFFYYFFFLYSRKNFL